jgi:hypothetical protein
MTVDRNLLKSAGAVDVSSRQKRRQAVSFVIELLSHIRLAEEAYMERIPENFQGGDAYADAECSIEAIDGTIEISNYATPDSRVLNGH